MNKSRFIDAVGRCFVFRPMPLAVGRGRVHEVWQVQAVEDEGLRLLGMYLSRTMLLPFDHIVEFMSNPQVTPPDPRWDFLILKSQIILGERGVRLEPLLRPQLALPRAAIQTGPPSPSGRKAAPTKRRRPLMRQSSWVHGWRRW